MLPSFQSVKRALDDIIVWILSGQRQYCATYNITERSQKSDY